MKPNINTTIESLLAKTKTMPNGCMEWLPSKDKNGYGYYMIMYKNLRAHRVMAALVYGEPQDKQIVLHSCDNPPCINPEHLSYGTQKENIRQKFDRNRANLSLGSNRKNSVLTEEIVLKARQMRAEGQSIVSISRHFGINQGTMYDAIKRITWKHL